MPSSSATDRAGIHRPLAEDCELLRGREALLAEDIAWFREHRRGISEHRLQIDFVRLARLRRHRCASE